MRIGIEVQRLFRPHKHGMDLVALRFLRTLQALDVVNEYFVFVRPGKDAACFTQTRNFHVIQLNALTYADWEQIRLPGAARSLKIDLLHCTSNTAPLFSPVPVVLTLHDVIFLDAAKGRETGATLYQQFGRFYRRLVVPRAVKRAEAIVTVSEHARGEILAHFPSVASKVRVIHNGVDDRFLLRIGDEAKSRAAARYRLPAEYFLFFGSRDPRKNTDGVLAAYDQYRVRHSSPLPLVIAGIDAVKIEELCRRLGLSDAVASSVIVPGYIDAEDMPALFAMSNGFLFPSLEEGFGIPIIEAMASGTPVVTSRRSSMPEVAGDAALLIDPTDPSAIAEAMIRLSQNSILVTDLIERGKARARGFAMDANASAYSAVYDNTVSALDRAGIPSLNLQTT